MPLCRVAFQDLNFAHRFRKCRTRNGSELRWMPYGMPRFRQEMILTAFYLYGKNPRTGEIEGPCGTGVFIARDASADLQPCPPHCYAVTARHVVAEGASIIRLNTLLGKPVKQSTRLLEHEPHEWQFIEGGDDLAALDVTEEIWPDPDETHPSTDFIRGTHEKDFVTGEFLGRVQLGVGEDGFMLGLFTPNPGTQFNMPAVRFGNISQLASYIHPIKQGHGQKHPSHVFDMHSRPGFSGSPVFVYRTPDSDLTAIDENGNFTLDLMRDDNAFIKLLGIHSGQFPESITAKEAESFKAAGAKLTVPSSMTVVIPAWRISELLDLPHFKEMRDMREKRVRSEGPEIIPEVAEVEQETDNPDHKEDFTRLLTAASRKQPQGD